MRRQYFRLPQCVSLLIQKKMSYIDKKGILKITAERKEDVNGKHCLQQAYWLNVGIISRGQI